ncbi:MAG: hypothetical protein JSV88_17085 [Candidatus Aminicenantes bacterium]|nr:MAG: hypothetical protein JSV88_17085 [Candidatus Aminicenantes bacterium]
MRNIIVGILTACLWGGILVTGSLYAKEKKEYTVAVKLERVEREPGLEQEIKVKDGKLFDSGSFAIVWAPAPQGFRFRIYNKMNSPITILWNECRFIDEKGNPHNISHKGVKRPSLSEMKAMIPTVVFVGGNWQDVFFPFDSDYIKHEKELVSFSQGAAASRTYGKAGLRIQPIFIDKYKEKQVKKIVKKKSKKDKNFNFETYINHHTYRVVMVLKFNETKYLYTFFFRAHLLDI